MDNIKAIALLSGGLDSILAARIVLEQGMAVEALNFNTVFCTCTSKDSSCMASVSAARQLGIPLKVVNVSREYLEIVKNPKHGYGSNMNPCIDCRIFTFKKAKEYMRQQGASFLITGEVVGQRPMSQKRHTLRHIEKEAGLDGLILRPLSAKSLEPTIPEKNRWVDRDKLLNMQGRGRKEQIQLAADFNIKDYPCPSGGCLLTDPGFAKRIKDLLGHDELTLENIHMLKAGRYFRVSDRLKAAAGRNERENGLLLERLLDGDVVFKVLKYPGPIVLARGRIKEEELSILAGIAARYSDAECSVFESGTSACRSDSQNNSNIRHANGTLYADVEYYKHPDMGSRQVIKAQKCRQELLDKMRV